MSPPAVLFPDHPFWEFSLAVYGGEGIAPACLELQDRRGIDVNLLLFCLWCASERQAAYDTASFRTIVAAADDWQRSVIQPMRAARRRLKTGSPHLPDTTTAALRREVLGAEIACEHGEQLIIVGVAATLPDPAPTPDVESAAAANLRAYCAAAGIGLEQDDASALRTILAAKLSGEAASSVAAWVLSGTV